MMRLAVAVAIAIAPAVAAGDPPSRGGPLPFLRDDGDSFVEARGALAGIGGPGVDESVAAADVHAQVLIGRGLGVYGVIGAARLVDTDTEENPGPPPHYDRIAATIPLDLELGAVARVHGGGGTALTASAGVVLPTITAYGGGFRDNAYTELVETDSVRALDTTTARAGVTGSVRHAGLIAAAHVGVDAGGAATRFDAALDVGGHTDGGTTITLGAGGYHTVSGARAGAFALGLGVAHAFGRFEASLALETGVSAHLDGGAALFAAARWRL